MVKISIMYKIIVLKVYYKKKKPEHTLRFEVLEHK